MSGNENNKNNQNIFSISKPIRRKTHHSFDNLKIKRKYNYDILTRKYIYLIIKNIKQFLNEKINLLYHGNKGIFLVKNSFIALKRIFNIEDFMETTIGEIFSKDISPLYRLLPKEHNKLIVDKLINEKDEYIKNYFKKIFNINMIQCFNHFCGKESIYILNGLKCFKDIKDEMMKNNDDGEEYINNLEYFLMNFENIFHRFEIKRRKRIRKSK